MDIKVDGRVAGKGPPMLVPRNLCPFDFHRLCHVSELDDLGLLRTGSFFCDAQGRPQLISVRDALKPEGGAGGFSCLEMFEFRAEECRATAFTGARALRLILDQTDQLKIVITLFTCTNFPQHCASFAQFIVPSSHKCSTKLCTSAHAHFRDSVAWLAQ